MNSAINIVHKLRKRFPEKIELHAHFKKPCDKLKNVNSKCVYPKGAFAFQFKNEKQKTNFMCLNHSFSKIKVKMKSKIER